MCDLGGEGPDDAVGHSALTHFTPRFEECRSGSGRCRGDTDSELSRSRAIRISICEGRGLVCDVLLPGLGTYTAAPCDAVAGISEMWSDLALSSGPALKEDLTVSMHRFFDVIL
jgi:hypothetical protein